MASFASDSPKLLRRGNKGARMPVQIRGRVDYGALRPNRDEVKSRGGNYDAEVTAWYARQPDIFKQFFDDRGRPRCRMCGIGCVPYHNEGFTCQSCAPPTGEQEVGKPGEVFRQAVFADVAAAKERLAAKKLRGT